MGDFGIFTQIQQFLEKGGPVLNYIMVLTFFMWAFNRGTVYLLRGVPSSCRRSCNPPFGTAGRTANPGTLTRCVIS